MPQVEPLDLPADPAERGVPVGQMTMVHDGVTLEVWYPASDSVEGQATEILDMNQFIPESVSTLLGDSVLPDIDGYAVRGATLRVPEAPYPVVVFSHGFGAFRLQSPGLTTHLASRGYVVVAADHEGRMLGDILPCLFSPPLEDCDMDAVLGGDPAPPQVEAALAWIEEAAAEGALAGALDTSSMAMVGFSAGGVSTSSVGQTEERFDALLWLAGAGETTRDVPGLFVGASCDAMFTMEELDAAYELLPGGQLVEILGSGHLAFTHLCQLQLGALADEVLAPREDVNQLFLDQLYALAVDGCPEYPPEEPMTTDCADGYLPLETSYPIIRHYTTVFLDQQLRGSGPGVEAGVFPEAVVR
jgi:dienelactone hydrolase